MEEDLYDEFGNYLGSPQSDSDDDGPEYWAPPKAATPSQSDEGEMGDEPFVIDEPLQEVVLYEDKKYYPELSEVYPDAETLIMEEDSQPITQPIVEPLKIKKFEAIEEMPETTFKAEFLCSMMHQPELIRNVVFAGHSQHGKTVLMDIFVEETHPNSVSDPMSPLKFFDFREDERLREISQKAKPMSLVLSDSRGKSFLFNVMDTPGHPDFFDEVMTAFRLCDGVFLVVDVIEGLTLSTERILKLAVSQNLPIVLILNKLDRLIIELKMPPGDTYYKLKHTLDQINGALLAADPTRKVFSPLHQNVIFASGLFGLAFTLHSFVEIYAKLYGPNFDKDEFAKRLWGDAYFDDDARCFKSKPPKTKAQTDRSFVQFILEPVYKLMTQTVSEEKETLEQVLASLGLYVKRSHFKLNTKTLLKIVMSSLTGKPTCIRDLAIRLFPPPHKAGLLERLYVGDRHGEHYEELKAAKPKGPVLVDIVKYFHRPDCETFDAFGRVLSGTIKKGKVLRVLGENYRTDDPEDMTEQTVTSLRVYNTRYRFEVTKVPVGNWVLIEGIETGISKTATALEPQLVGRIERLLPFKFRGSVVKVAIEPFVPSDLPKLLEAIRKVNKSYPQLQFHVEESGEHVLIGTGELYMDAVLHDIRTLYSDIEVKLSDPFVSLSETVIDTSSFKAYADTPNKQNRLSVIAEPLEGKLITDVETGMLKLSNENLAAELERKYDWDILAANNLWAFGPQLDGPNAFLNDILPGDGDVGLLGAVRDSVVQGFQWACREGPLCEEALRGVKFRLIQATLAELPIYRSGGQIIPSVKRVCNSAFLLASPRLLEPYYITEIQCTQDCMPAILTLLQLRRGHINSEEPKSGSPLYTITASIPILEAFGFETDLRTKTSGMAFCLSHFDHWGLVPGDPLDRKIQLRPLEPAPIPHLSREFMLKTRRRKGLTEDIVVSKYFDAPGLLELAREDQDLAQYF